MTAKFFCEMTWREQREWELRQLYMDLAWAQNHRRGYEVRTIRRLIRQVQRELTGQEARAQ